MCTSDEERLRKQIDYWREEGLIAEEHGDEGQASEHFERAEALERECLEAEAAYIRANAEGEHSEWPFSLGVPHDLLLTPPAARTWLHPSGLQPKRLSNGTAEGATW